MFIWKILNIPMRQTISGDVSVRVRIDLSKRKLIYSLIHLFLGSARGCLHAHMDNTRTHIGFPALYFAAAFLVSFYLK